MPRTVAIGHQNFETVRNNNYFYIDKTEFIRQWWESGDIVTLITRPRRFGKTLNMSMLSHFFSAEYAGRGDLFQGLSIWNDEGYRQIQGTYPVIFLSFASIKENSFLEVKKSICRTIEELYNKRDYLLQGNLLNEKEKDYYREVSANMSDSTAAASLPALSDYLFRYHGKRVIFLLDEYDAPMQEAYVNGYWAELAAFTRSLFNAAFKTNPYLERAIMTGITRVSKESIFSDLNNMEVVTTTSDKYETSFGFTEKEVFAALEEYNLSDKKQDVKKWYDGFTFGNVPDIYNPWSIIHYLDKKKFMTYWANTSSNSLAGKVIQEGAVSVKEAFEELISGETVLTEIDEQIVYNQLDLDESAVWSLLLASGYLKVKSVKVQDSGYGDWRQVYELGLTNFEVQVMFRNMVRSWFAPAASSYNGFIKALMADDIDAMNVYMNRVAMNTFRYFDTGVNASEDGPERFYHGFVLGLIVELAGRYIILSNRESGFGRYDVLLEPLDAQDDAMILEFKVLQPGKESSLEETAENAITQIAEKKYEASLIAKGVRAKRIRKIGFAFRGKEVLIKEG